MTSEESSVFTKIINREIPGDIIFENERIIVIKNIAPQAPVHLLGITKYAYKNLHQLLHDPHTPKDLLWELFKKLTELAEELGIAESGYKLVVNTGPDAGQTVFHLHVHLIGGTKLEE